MNRRRLMKKSSDIELDPVTGRGYVGDYEVVDLGLPSGLLWATRDVNNEGDYSGFAYNGDANPIENIGMFFQWGAGRSSYTSNQQYDTSTSGGFSYLGNDTARQIRGNKWRMPTKEDFQELLQYTTYELNPNGDVNFTKFTSKTNPSAYVIFRNIGYYNSSGKKKGSSVYNNYGRYWTSTGSNDTTFAYGFDPSLARSHAITNYSRALGFLVRAVTQGGKLTLFKRILNFLKSLVKKGGDVC